tara:strand:- start:1691 stop:2470 length:780 start_codon:yes stop_codon:yes gene_type:complete
MADGIPNTGSARRDSHNVFVDYLKSKNTDPAMGNLYSVVITPPPVLTKSSNNSLYTQFAAGRGNKQMHRLINMYATAVNLPSKQMTTGQVVTIGSPFKYVTGTAYSQISITFMMPRDHSLRMLFEAWMNMMIADANHYIEDYEEYVCPFLRIYKFERGFGDKAFKDPGYDGQMRQNFNKNDKKDVRLNELTGCFELRKAFPYNIGSAQLNNNDARLLTYSIGFNFERYRFFPRTEVKPQFPAMSKSIRENIQISADRMD